MSTRSGSTNVPGAALRQANPVSETFKTLSFTSHDRLPASYLYPQLLVITPFIFAPLNRPDKAIPYFFYRGLLIVAKYRKERVAAIAQALSDSSYDIVALQELWVYSDYELVKAKVVNRFPYAKFFHGCVHFELLVASEVPDGALRGALGAGLAFFSRFPIIGATSHPYSLAGSPLDVLGGDWFVGKAAVSVLLAHPILGQLQVFNSHVRRV